MRLPWKRREQWQERLGRNKTILWEKLREALASVVPITVIVLILSFTVAPIPTETLLAFLIGAVMVILGIGLFSLGADTAMTPIGERVGAAMTRSRKLWVVAAVGFLIGVIVTVSEPDLQVLAQQVPGVPNATLVGAVAVGVGVFLVIAMLRILFRIPLNRMLIVFYILVFALALFVPEDFLAIAFDSGGVTTGPMTVRLSAAGRGRGLHPQRRECRPGQLRPGGSLFCRPHPGGDGAGPDLPGRGRLHPGGNPLRDRQPGSVAPVSGGTSGVSQRGGGVSGPIALFFAVFGRFP